MPRHFGEELAMATGGMASNRTSTVGGDLRTFAFLDEYDQSSPESTLERHLTTKSKRSSHHWDLPPPDVELGVKEEKDNAFKVSWDGDDDPQNPLNWNPRHKQFYIGVLSVITFLTPLASSMFAPGVPDVMKEFGSDNTVLGSFVVSVYLLGYGVGPMLFAPLAEIFGRLPIYHGAIICFLGFNLACGFATNMNMLIGFRFLSGFFGSPPTVIGGGTIADMFPVEQRGRVLALWSMGPLMGPVVGPIAGGFCSEGLGWRWNFYIITIACGIFTFGQFILYRETYAPVLLEKKAAKLRKSTGDDRYVSALATGQTTMDLFKAAIIRPVKLLILSPIVTALSLYVAVSYGYLYLLFTTFTDVFQGQYGFSNGIVGLAYIGIGVGLFSGLFIFGTISDKAIKRVRAKGGNPTPELRLPAMIPAAMLLPVGFFWYGWSAEAKVHWIVPILGTTVIGLGLIGLFMPNVSYLVDAFNVYAASATAANSLVRSVVGALLPLAGPPLYKALGYGWGNSVLGFVALALAPIPILLFKYGEMLRTRWPLKL